MSFLTHILHLGVKEVNEGVIVVWNCPRCDELRDYHLIVSKGNFSLAGLEFSKPATMLDLRCSGCQFELRVAPAERELLMQVREATRRLKNGELTAELYVAAIRELPARFAKDLIALTQNWNCPKCGEANPVTFDSCWNCGAKGGVT